MTPKEYRAFLNWANYHSHISGDKHLARGVMNDGADEARRTYGLAGKDQEEQ
jgi:hypothetical protein